MNKNKAEFQAQIKMGKKWKLLKKNSSNAFMLTTLQEVVEMFVVIKKLQINEKPGRYTQRELSYTALRRCLPSCGERRRAGQKGREPRGV